MTRDDEASSRDEGREGAFGAMRVGYIPPVGSSRIAICTTPRLRRIMNGERARSFAHVRRRHLLFIYTHNFTHPRTLAESRHGWSYDISYHGLGALGAHT